MKFRLEPVLLDYEVQTRTSVVGKVKSRLEPVLLDYEER